MRKTLRNMFMQSLRVAFTAAFVAAWMYTALPSLFSFPPRVPEAQAAISLVQKNGGHTSSQSLALAFGSNNTAGNLLVVVAGDYAQGATYSASDSAGNAYTMATSINTTGLSTSNELAVLYAANAKGGANTVTVNSNLSEIQVQIYEYAGISPVNPLDQVGSVLLGTAGSISVTTVGATAQPNELVMAFIQTANFNPTPTFTAGTGYAIEENVNDAANFENTVAEDMIATSVGRQTATFTDSDGASGGQYGAVIVTFRTGGGTTVSNRSDTLSDSRTSVTSNHTFSFRVNSAVSGSSTLTLALPFTVPDTLNCGDVDAATSSPFNFNYPACAATATAWGFTANGSVLTLHAPTDSTSTVHVATTTQISLYIGSNATTTQQGVHWITNPSTAGAYTITLGGTSGNTGNFLVAIGGGQTVQVQVAESLALSVSSISAGSCTADDGALITALWGGSTSIPFGTVAANSFYQSCHDLVVSTNAANGYSLTGQESSALLAANGKTIPDTKCDAGLCTAASSGPWVTPTKNGFGHTCLDQVGHDCTGTYNEGTKFRPFANVAGGTGGIGLVQKNGAFTNTQTSLAVAFSSNNSAGNLLVVVAGGYSSTVFSSMSDSAGNTYTMATSINSGISGGNAITVWYAANAKGGANTVTVNCNLSAMQVQIYEYAGISPVNPLDQVGSVLHASTDASELISVTTVGTLAQPSELVMAFAQTANTNNSPTFTAGTGYTLEENVNDPQNFENTVGEDMIATSVGRQTATMTSNDGAGQQYGAVIVTFRASSAAGETIMSSSTPSTATGRIKYRLSRGTELSAGVYSNIVDYIITATY